MKEVISYLDSWKKEKGQHNIFERSFVRGDTKCGSSCWLLPLVNLFSFLLLFLLFWTSIVNIFLPIFLYFGGGLCLVSFLDSWWILELSWIHYLDFFIEKIVNSFFFNFFLIF